MQYFSIITGILMQLSCTALGIYRSSEGGKSIHADKPMIRRDDQENNINFLKSSENYNHPAFPCAFSLDDLEILDPPQPSWRRYISRRRMPMVRRFSHNIEPDTLKMQLPEQQGSVQEMARRLRPRLAQNFYKIYIRDSPTFRLSHFSDKNGYPSRKTLSSSESISHENQLHTRTADVKQNQTGRPVKLNEMKETKITFTGVKLNDTDVKDISIECVAVPGKIERNIGSKISADNSTRQNDRGQEISLPQNNYLQYKQLPGRLTGYENNKKMDHIVKKNLTSQVSNNESKMILKDGNTIYSSLPKRADDVDSYGKVVSDAISHNSDSYRTFTNSQAKPESATGIDRIIFNEDRSITEETPEPESSYYSLENFYNVTYSAPSLTVTIHDKGATETTTEELLETKKIIVPELPSHKNKSNDTVNAARNVWSDFQQYGNKTGQNQKKQDEKSDAERDHNEGTQIAEATTSSGRQLGKDPRVIWQSSTTEDTVTAPESNKSLKHRIENLKLSSSSETSWHYTTEMVIRGNAERVKSLDHSAESRENQVQASSDSATERDLNNDRERQGITTNMSTIKQMDPEESLYLNPENSRNGSDIYSVTASNMSKDTASNLTEGRLQDGMHDIKPNLEEVDATSETNGNIRIAVSPREKSSQNDGILFGDNPKTIRGSLGDIKSLVDNEEHVRISILPKQEPKHTSDTKELSVDGFTGQEDSRIQKKYGSRGYEWENNKDFFYSRREQPRLIGNLRESPSINVNPIKPDHNQDKNARSQELVRLLQTN